MVSSKTKLTGSSDGISGQMLLLCNESVILPLRIIFRNISSTAIYPDVETCYCNSNIQKRRQLKITNQNLSFLFVVTSLKKLFLTILTTILLHITNLDFDLVSTTNQLIDLVNDIHCAFDCNKSLEVCSIFLDI